MVLNYGFRRADDQTVLLHTLLVWNRNWSSHIRDSRLRRGEMRIREMVRFRPYLHNSKRIGPCSIGRYDSRTDGIGRSFINDLRL